MKITIDIEEEEIIEQAKSIAAEQIAKTLLGYYRDGTAYRQLIKEIVREVIKADKKNLEDRAVAAAAKSLKKDAIKKLLAEETEE